MSALRFLSLLLLALWIGGLAAVGGLAAPTIFNVLQAHDPVAGRTLAGDVFGAVFLRVQHASWIVGGLLLGLLAIRAALGPRPRHTGPRVGIVILMIAASVGTAVIIAPRIDRLRASVTGSISDLSDGDARKIEFSRLHGLSNSLMLLTLAAGLGLLWFETHDVH
jgi:uncharacterized protein DUF4149